MAKAVESLHDDVTANQVLLKQVNDTLTSIRQENAELKEMVKQRDTIIESLTERVTTVEQRLRAQDSLINDLEQYSRKTSIRITGLVVKNQDYLAEVINVFKSNLKLSVTPADLVAVHPLPRRQGVSDSSDHPPPVLVKFVRPHLQADVIRARRKLVGTEIVIREDLTKLNQQLLMSVKGRQDVENVWSVKGTIFCKLKSGRKLRVSLTDDLEALLGSPTNQQKGAGRLNHVNATTSTQQDGAVSGNTGHGGAKPRRMINVSQPNTSSMSYDLRRRRLVTSTPVPQSLANRLTRLAGMDPGSPLTQTVYASSRTRRFRSSRPIHTSNCH